MSGWWFPRAATALWLLACCGVCAAQMPPACPPTAEPPTPQQIRAGTSSAADHGFLWRIRKNGRISFLYGTFHVGEATWVSPGPLVMAALHGSDEIALELDMLDPRITEQLRDGMAAQAGRHLPAPLANRLAKQVSAACLPTAVLEAMAPEMLATTLTVLAGRADGLDPAYGIDLTLARLGRMLHRPVISLETSQQQIALLQGRTPKETDDIVEEAVDELETGHASPLLQRMARIWSEGSLDELESYAQWCDCLRTDEERALFKRLLDDRNPSLAEHIEALHASGKRVFAAVGSLHMIGPMGLPALLARHGFVVERVASTLH